MKNVYIQNEAKKGFKDWTKQGLEFLLSLSSKDKRMQYKIKKKLEKLKRQYDSIATVCSYRFFFLFLI